jgi:hypothetical protein
LVIWAEGLGRQPRVDFVELKRPGGKLEDHQEREHEKLRSLGCAVFTLDSIKDVDAYVARRTS